MPDPHDIFDENMSHLLHNAAAPPKLDPGRKEQMLTELKKQFDRAPAGKPDAQEGTPIMLRLVRCASYAVAAAAIVVVAWLIFRPAEPELAPWKVVQDSARTEQLDDGTVLYVKGSAKYALAGRRRVKLDSGQILLFVAKDAEPFVVETPHGRAEARGTKFTVAAADDATFVAVGQGRVDVVNDAGGVAVGAGQQAQIDRDRSPCRGAAPRFTHLVNWAREQLAGDDPFDADRAGGAGADGSELKAVDPWGQQVRLELREYKVDVVVEDGIARTTIDQTFFNQLPWQIEGTFYFPLPPDASLSRLAMYVSGTLNEGGMVDRQYGRMVYESIVYRRRDPALLEMMEGNVFKMRVFPIFGRQEKRIIISYTQTLPELYKTLRYWLPMEHANDEAKTLSITVRVKGAAGKVEAASSTHPIATRADDGDMLIEYSEDNVAPDQDFLLHLTPTGGAGGALRCATIMQDGKRFLFVKVRPKAAPAADAAPEARQWIVINDVSASRSAVDIKAQAFILGRLLAEADDDDTFALINLDTRARPWRYGLTGVRDAAASGAIAFAEVSCPMGATNIAAAFAQAGRIISHSGAANAHIVYLGDGVATDSETAVDRLIAAMPPKATFVGIGVGKKVNATFLQAAANATGGIFTTMNPSEDLTWRALDMVAAMNTPRLTGVETVFTDAGGGVLNVDAYPSSGTLSDGEALTVLARTDGTMPARMVLKARAGDEIVEETYDLMPPVDGAAYAPRLWAAARINHLLRDGADQHKKEIVELSKAYYVVTPFTSLIVLENEADYKKWKVETGRKDHWQLYPAPAKIKVVREPLTRNYWEGPDAPPMKGTPGRPGTIEEIVESVQFRVATPLYGYYQHQRRRMERFGLYALISGRIPSAAWGQQGALPALPLPEEDEERDLGGGGEFFLDTGLGLPDVGADLPPMGRTSRSSRIASGFLDFTYDSKGKGLGFAKQFAVDPMSLTSESLMLTGRLRGILAGDVKNSGADDLYETYKWSSVLFDSDGDGSLLGSKLELDGRYGHGYLAESLLPMSGLGLERRKDQLISALAPDNYMDFDGGWMDELEGKRRRPAGGIAASAGGFHAAAGRMDVKGLKRFNQAAMGRWLGDRERIRQYNARYSGWGGYWDSGWDEGRRMVAGMDLLRDYSGMLDVTVDFEKELAPATPPMPEPPVRLLRPLGSLMDEKASSEEIMPAFLLGAHTRAMGSVAGSLSTWTADRIIPAREKILAMTDAKGRDAVVAAIDAFVAKLPKMSAATESTGVFWSHRGWQDLPTRWDFIQPQAQSWAWSRNMIDLTRYAPALQSTWADVADEVVAKFGKKPAGTVDAEAARRIAAARAGTPEMEIAYLTKKGKTILTFQAGPEDRFAWTGRTSMYLKQDVVCDGKHVYHVYPELGLAARRSAVRRVASMRRLVPHLLPPADELARVWNVALAAGAGELTTLRLTPAALKKTDKAEPADTTGAKRPEFAILVTFDGRGFVRKTQWQVDGKTKLTRTIVHKDSQITVTWQGVKGEPATGSYRCAIVKNASSPFAPPSDPMVVLDMPLRRPAHYEALLKDVDKNVKTDDKAVDEQRRLRRHLAMAYLQDHAWRAPWGQPTKVWQTMLTALGTHRQTGVTTVTLGDYAIMGSAGYAGTIRSQNQFGGTHANGRLMEYWVGMNNATSMKTLADAQKGTLVGHLARHMQLIRTGGAARPALAREMMRDYPASPLLYAAAIHSCGSDQSIWLDLAKMPRWRALALYSGAQHGATNSPHSHAIAAAFEDYHKTLIEKSWEVPISSRLAGALKAAGRLDRVMKRWSDAVVKSKNPGAMLRLAEFAWAHGLKDIAAAMLADAEKLVAPAAPLTWRLARAQAMWAMGRYAEAFADQQAVLDGLEAKGITPSPAMLAASARLAQRAGKPDRAVDLELAALTAEQPYMPKQINVHLFRQRYQWLWNQLTARVRQHVGKKDAADRKALADAMGQATDVWRTWSRVDTANSANLHSQLATLYRAAGDKDEAWRVISTVIDVKPKDGASYYQVGAWYRGFGANDDAQQWYAKAYHTEPTNGDWIWHRAELLRSMGRTDDAQKLYQEIATKKWQPRFQHYTNQAKKRLK